MLSTTGTSHCLNGRVPRLTSALLPLQERMFLLAVLLHAIGLIVMGFVYAAVATSAPDFSASLPNFDADAPHTWDNCSALNFNVGPLSDGVASVR